MRILFVEVAVTLLVVLVGHGTSVKYRCICTDEPVQSTCSSQENSTTGILSTTNPTTMCNLSEDYCKYCAGHPACATSTMKSSCSAKESVSEVRFTSDQQKLMLDITNEYRNRVASGQTPKPTAMRMGTLQWDCRLEDFAIKNALQCEFRHDECRQTHDYPFAGQNLYMIGRTSGFFPVEEVIPLCVAAFYNEIVATTNDDITELKSRANFGEIGHFTQLMQEENDRMGCGIAQYKDNGYYFSICACNYNAGNLLGRPVYRAGPMSSLCTTGSNSQFSGLCSVNEVYNRFD